MGDAQTPRKCGSHGRFARARIAHHRHTPHSTTLRVGANNLPDRDRKPLTQRHVQAALAINRSPSSARSAPPGPTGVQPAVRLSPAGRTPNGRQKPTPDREPGVRGQCWLGSISACGRRVARCR
jgi:hypothetical protein